MAAEAYLPNWSVRCLSVPGPDTDLSLFVSFDNARFLFGAGEGTQRAFVQKKLGMRGLAAIFLPSGQPAGRNGLPGVIMTAADMGIKKLAIVGPPDTAQFISSFRGSVIRDQFGIDVHAYPLSSSSASEEIYRCPSMTVRAVALRPSLLPFPPSSTLAYSLCRPSLYDPSQLRSWCEQIVRDMFRHVDQPQIFSSRTPTSCQPASSSNTATSKPSHPQPPSQSQTHSQLPRPSAPDDRFPLPLPTETDLFTEMVYICQAPDIRGKFDVAKAESLKVPNGRLRGKLVKGEAIEVSDPEVEGGTRIVKPEDCLVGGGPGAVLIIVNCSEHNLDSLLSSSAFDGYQHGALPVHCVVHHVPSTVWQDTRYQEWMGKFSPETQHLIADPQGSQQMFYNSSAWNILQQSLIDSDMFPIPSYSIPSSLQTPVLTTLPANSTLLVPNHFVRMHPMKPVEVLQRHEKDRIFPTTTEEVQVALQMLRSQSPEYAAAVDIARQRVAEEGLKRVGTKSCVGDDIVLTTLGTGSAIPSKYRNVSSTYIDVPDVGGILLDAGEGTLGQLRRRFGEKTKAALEKLKLVFISHMHADHHLGLPAILEERFKLGITSKLYLIAPHAIALQLQESRAWQQGVEDKALENVEYINIVRLKTGFAPPMSLTARDYMAKERIKENIDGSVNESRTVMPWNSTVGRQGGSPSSLLVERLSEEDIEAGVRKWPFENVYRFSPVVNRRQEASIYRLLNDLGLDNIRAPNVEHRGPAYGLVMTHKTGWKLVYSGDTKPCRDLVEAGKGATVLIHEATLEDDKPEIAAAKGHSTFSQAIEVGKKMKATHVLLNHFSQRYPKIPKLPQPASCESDAPVVSISFDLMSIRIGDMWKMSYYMDALSLLYPEEMEDGDSVIGDDESGGEAMGGTGSGNAVDGVGGEKGKIAKKEKARQQHQQQKSERNSTNSSDNSTNGKNKINQNVSKHDGNGGEISMKAPTSSGSSGKKVISSRAQRKLEKRQTLLNAHGKRPSESSLEGEEVMKRIREVDEATPAEVEAERAML